MSYVPKFTVGFFFFLRTTPNLLSNNGMAIGNERNVLHADDQ